VSAHRVRSVLVHVPGALGENLAGPEIRAVEFARALAQDYDVTLAAGEGEDGQHLGIPVVRATRPRLLREAARHDALLSSSLPPFVLASKPVHRFVAITDQYDPHEEEILTKQQSEVQRRRELRTRAAMQALQLAHADVVLCAGERQREQLLQRFGNLLGPGSGRPEPTVIPFGIPDPPAPSGRHPLRERFPQIAAGDTVVLWWGSVWRWLDADTAVRAFAALAPFRPDIKLVITAGRAPREGAQRFYNAGEEARQLAAELDVLDKNVLFLDDWIPYEQRHDYLRDADIGITLHRHGSEARLAVRARYMDYLSAGLPCVLGRGDEAAEEFATAGFATLVAEPKPEELAAKLLALADDPESLTAARAAGRRLVEHNSWSAVGTRLRKVVAGACAGRATPPHACLALVRQTSAYYARRLPARLVAP
jgi:glycosyltransferase involved in cell wall biosynthesis